MTQYCEDVEKQMRGFFAQLFGIDCKTIRQGQHELAQLENDPLRGRIRKKARGASESSS